VPTLEALARSFETDRPYDAIAAWMDGQRGEIFGILYDSGGRELMPAIAGRPERVLDGWHFSADRSVVFIGDGAVRFRSIIEDRFGAAARVIQPVPLAGTIGRIACADPQRAVAPHEIVPIYVRRPDAELARERRRAAPPTAPVQNRELE
jgi:tRNA A37 threonylcarbamoyladenosine modification protein TsaB